jgi:isoquinoline 1-oxidoreductase beta subunit
LNAVLDSDRYTRDIIRHFEDAMSSSGIATVAVDRRSFLKVAGGVGGGLILALCVAAPKAVFAQAGPPGAPRGPAFAPGAYVRIAPSGKITLLSKNPEIGQGIKTAFGLILAEELDCKWSDVTVEQSPINAAVYGAQFAGGSLSIPMNWDALRQAGAGARAMLVAAAAKEWGVPESEITTSDSMVKHSSSNRSLSYGTLADRAAAMPVPADPKLLKLKDRKDYKLLGNRFTGVDNLQLVTGKPLFGIDVQVPGAYVAILEKCPAVGGKVQSANLDEIKQLPGVKDAFIVEGNGKPTEVMPGVAIVAKNTWSAFSARKKLKIVWDESTASKDSWTQFAAKAKELSTQQGSTVLKTSGDVEQAFAADKTAEGFYTFAFVSHAQLEPQNCTAWYKIDPAGDTLEMWAPSQTPGGAQTLVAGVVGLTPDKVTIHQTRIGGGFGRRLMNDYAAESAQISKQAGGVPVKLMWTREDDMQHDFYRAGGFQAFKGAVDAKGKLSAWSSHTISFTADGKAAVAGGGWGANEFPAQYTPNYRATQTLLPLAIPCGPWRAPGSNVAGWVVQSFMHELSVAAKRDHAEFLLDVFAQKQPADPNARPGPPGGGGLNADRAAGVIKLAVEKSGWGKKLPKGHFQGIAFHFSHQGHFAEVAEVSVDSKKKVTVHRMTVVADIGPIVNLSGAENQAQGCIVDAISTMGLEVTIENGRIEQKNFDKYPLGRMPITPQVDVHFVVSEYGPTGMGEPAFPPAAPAICNAIYAATGTRIRTLPITKQGFST